MSRRLDQATQRWRRRLERENLFCAAREGKRHLTDVGTHVEADTPTRVPLEEEPFHELPLPSIEEPLSRQRRIKFDATPTHLETCRYERMQFLRYTPDGVGAAYPTRREAMSKSVDEGCTDEGQPITPTSWRTSCGGYGVSGLVASEDTASALVPSEPKAHCLQAEYRV
jgi:hypothetical protein